MRYFSELSTQGTTLFQALPGDFTMQTDRETLAASLGGTLYMPGTRPHLRRDLQRQLAQGVRSVVICLEDAIADDQVVTATDNVIQVVHSLHDEPIATPLLFIRARTPDHIADILSRLGPAADVLCGFALPKFTGETGPAFLTALRSTRTATSHRLYALPIIETPDVLHLQTRAQALEELSDLLNRYRSDILAVRLGATDLSAAYGLRRPVDRTVYDMPLLTAAITDIINVLGRPDGTGFTITGPVWEHWGSQQASEGLRHEARLDILNGLTGKTIIHPSQARVVHALLAVTDEDFQDAHEILDHAGGGVAASRYRNKMNELNPHAPWARRILKRATVYGALRPEATFEDLAAAA